MTDYPPRALIRTGRLIEHWAVNRSFTVRQKYKFALLAIIGLSKLASPFMTRRLFELGTSSPILHYCTIAPKFLSVRQSKIDPFIRLLPDTDYRKPS